jgi:hypothetical protein
MKEPCPTSQGGRLITLMADYRVGTQVLPQHQKGNDVNTKKKAMGLLFVMFSFFVIGVAEAQINISKDKSGGARTFLAGKLSLARDIDSVENELFVCKVLIPLEKGDIAAMTSADQAWSIRKESMEVGKQKESFSVMAIAKANDGAFRTFFPAWMQFKIDIATGKTIKSGYQIQTTRAIKTGNRIPCILIGLSAMLSMESEEGAKDSNAKEQPWLIVHEGDLNGNGRSALIDIWRIATEHIRK